MHDYFHAQSSYEKKSYCDYYYSITAALTTIYANMSCLSTVNLLGILSCDVMSGVSIERSDITPLVSPTPPLSSLSQYHPPINPGNPKTRNSLLSNSPMTLSIPQVITTAIKPIAIRPTTTQLLVACRLRRWQLRPSLLR